MALDKTGKQLIDFNVHDVGFWADGGSAIIPLTYAAAISLDKQLSTKIIYGDGMPQLSLYNDNGYSITLELTAEDKELEIALGFKKELATGLADIQVTKSQRGSLFFEVDYAGTDGVRHVKKCWLFGVELTPPSPSLSQDEDEINNANVSYSGTIYGTNLKDSAGTADYVDSETGITPKVYKLSAIPTDDFYSSFEASVPIPKASA